MTKQSQNRPGNWAWRLVVGLLKVVFLGVIPTMILWWRPAGRFWRFVKWTLIVGLSAFRLACLTGGAAGLYLWHKHTTDAPLPDVAKIMSEPPRQSTKVYDRNGELIGEIFAERRVVLAPAEIPLFVKYAFLSAEDKNFDEHGGMDYWATVKAAVQGVKSGGRFRGASTITQQLAKRIVGKDRSLRRKIREAAVAFEIEQRYQKSEILAFYLNTIEFGNRRFGVEEASRYYFGKSAQDLNLGEAALLAALPKAQEKYPRPEWHGSWKIRQRYVLREMVDNHWATPEAAEKAARAPIALTKSVTDLGVAPEFVDKVTVDLQEQYGPDLSRLGGRIKTTCDPDLQIAMRAALKKGLDYIDSQNSWRSRPQGAAIALDPRTREVLAMVGGYDNDRQPGQNRALPPLFDKDGKKVREGTRRQPGSTFKPIVWAAAFNQREVDPRITPSTAFYDVEKTYKVRGSLDWTPKNHGGSSNQLATLRYSLAHSLNTVSAQVTEVIGPEAVEAMAKTLGITAELRRPLEAPPKKREAKLSLALGTSEVSVLELANAYAVLADRGQWRPAVFILAENDTPRTVAPAEQRVSPALAFQLTHLMQSVIQDGTGVRAKGKLDRPAAGKTGTTQDATDAWFVGYTPELLIAVWVGYDQPRSMGGYWEGSRAALPIWIEAMKAGLKNRPSRGFGSPPPGVMMVGGEVYLSGTVPAGAPALRLHPGAMVPAYIPPSPDGDGGTPTPPAGRLSEAPTMVTPALPTTSVARTAPTGYEHQFH